MQTFPKRIEITDFSLATGYPVTSFHDHFVPNHFVPSFGHFVPPYSHFIPKNSHKYKLSEKSRIN